MCIYSGAGEKKSRSKTICGVEARFMLFYLLMLVIYVGVTVVSVVLYVLYWFMTIAGKSLRIPLPKLPVESSDLISP